MSYVRQKMIKGKGGKMYGPYDYEVESVRDGDTVRQVHIAYLGKSSGAGVGSRSVQSGDYTGAVSSLSGNVDEYGNLKMNKELNDTEMATINAIHLWSEGDIASVINPRNYDSSKADANTLPISSGKVKYTVNGESRTLDIGVSKGDYIRANTIIGELANTPYSQRGQTLYRGVGLTKEAISGLRIGASVNLAEVTSLTTSRSTASRFAGMNTQEGKRAVRMEISNIRRGTNITKLSPLQHENEFLSSGKIRIMSIIELSNSHTIKAIQL